MAWLRIDDAFTSNGKIAQLDDAQFRVWMRVLCFCASARDPSVDEAAIREISGLDRRRIQTFNRLQLLDEIGDHFEVHDWAKYLPRDAQNADRQARWRSRQRNATRNGEVTQPEGENVTLDPSRARAGTRGSPSRTRTPEEKTPVAVPVPEAHQAAQQQPQPDDLTIKKIGAQP